MQALVDEILSVNLARRPKPLAVFIMGPTASGKTDLAMRLYDCLPCELISVDSALIYQGMNIGSAKPNKQELENYPHHLIDMIDPAQNYSAADFRRDALNLMSDIQEKGKIPVLVGGTMMYYNLLLKGLSDLPSASPVVRAEIDQMAAEHGWAYVHGELDKIDPVSAERINPNDPQRIQRALEVYKISGKTMTQFRQEEAQSKGQDYLAEFPFDVVQIALAPDDRSILHERIKQRFIKMCDSGFVAEVEQLKARGDLDLSMPSMRCVGYRQVWQYLEGEFDYDTMLEKGVVATRQLAKRQLTWLRGWQDVNWIYTSNEQQALSKSELFYFMQLEALKIINQRLKK